MTPFSPVRRFGALVALSGQIGLRDEALVSGGFTAELHQALANLGDLLDNSGLRRSDVIKTTVYLVDIADWERRRCRSGPESRSKPGP